MKIKDPAVESIISMTAAVVAAIEKKRGKSDVIASQHIALPLLKHSVQRQGELSAYRKFGSAKPLTRSSTAFHTGCAVVGSALGAYLSVTQEADLALPEQMFQDVVMGALTGAVVANGLKSAAEILAAAATPKPPSLGDITSTKASAITQLPPELIQEIAEAHPDAAAGLASTATTVRAKVGGDLATWGFISKRTATLRAQSSFSAAYASTTHAPSATVIDRAFNVAASFSRAMMTGRRNALPVTEILQLLGAPQDENDNGASGAYGLRSDKLKQAALAEIEAVLDDYGIKRMQKVYDGFGSDTGRVEAVSIRLTGVDALSPRLATSIIAGFEGQMSRYR